MYHQVNLLFNQVSFKYLSRHLSITNDQAKELLLQFVNGYQSKNQEAELNVIYYTAQIKVGAKDAHKRCLISLTSNQGGKGLQSAHIYAVSKAPILDPNTLYIQDTQLMLSDDVDLLSKTVYKMRNPLISHSAPNGAVLKGQLTVSIAKDTGNDARTSKAPAQHPLQIEKVMQPKGPLFGKSMFFAQPEKPTPVQTSFAASRVIKPTSPQSSARGLESTSTSASTSSSPVAKTSAFKASTEKSVDHVAKLMPAVSPPKPSENACQEQEIRDLFIEEPSGETCSIDEEPTSVEDSEQQLQASSNLPATRRVRKKRKVTKTVMVQEGKYMKTKDVEGWESYSEDEPVHVSMIKKAKPAQPLHATAASNSEGVTSSSFASKAASVKGKGASKKPTTANQKSITSFFAKH